ncbi:hypothetical protein OOZ19_07905 [Saccharopolyspora sp. NFXS83]|uniref:hypothetical protein n=1 Tax=Saccharopolyspora sp. NFXS83 TaxID=2993560 RepID=UPI00224ADE0F|nr:hypothetical protein [Saccharopolyspora sp. NFXS83]MCX2730162.1 hypothetical protein [Saccharopolyspora sp. NFXS83]
MPDSAFVEMFTAGAWTPTSRAGATRARLLSSSSPEDPPRSRRKRPLDLYNALVREVPDLRPAASLDEIPLKNAAALFGLHALPVTW